MSNISALTLIGFVTWAVFLVMLMEALRTDLIMRKQIRPSALTPDNGNLSAFMQRLTRAHANCLENLPVIGGLLLLAIAQHRTDLTDPLAPAALAARLVQSTIHVASGGDAAVTARFLAYLVQLAVTAVWIFALVRSNL